MTRLPFALRAVPPAARHAHLIHAASPMHPTSRTSHMAQTLAPQQPRGPVTGTAAGPKKKRKFFLLDLYGTAVGKKYVMAITGVIGIGFIVAHMIGNLKMYLGKGEGGVY